jgi:hypothetical protein
MMLTVSDTHPTLQSGDPLGIKDVSDHSVGLDLVESSSLSTSDDTSGILTTDMSELLL